MADIKRVDNEALFADVEQILDEGGRIQLHVKGHSMRPFLRNGIDTVHLAAVSGDDLRPGMVVLFRYRGRHIMHRLRRIKGSTLEIKGDGNYRISECVPRSEVSAYVESMERNGRSIGYRSARWRLLTAWSLSVKAARTMYRDAKRVLKGKNSL